MKARFWGVRGSLPTPIGLHSLEDKLVQALQGASRVPLDDPAQVRSYVASLPLHLRGTFGGHTSCVQVTSARDSLILDAGSGLFRLGEWWARQDERERPRAHHIFLSHLHWDHTIGLPHYAPLFRADNRLVVYGAHPDFEGQLLAQHAPPNFPLPLSAFPASVSFQHMVPGVPVEVGCLRVTCMELPHPGRSFAFRVEDGQSALVYATDAEYRDLSPETTRDYVAFFQGAGVLIMDAQYDSQESLEKKRDWGHSSPLAGAALCIAAGVSRLILFHHDPSSSDEAIAAMEVQVQEYLDREPSPLRCRATAAYEDLEIDL